MPNSAHNIKNNDGFISIIAVGVFALLMIFAISMQMTIIDTLNSLKNNANHDTAQDIADSSVEYLQFAAKSYGPGINDSATCVYNGGNLDTQKSVGSLGLCTNLKTLSGNKNVTATFSVKGRATDTSDAIKTAKYGTFGKVYITPLAGTGDAGKNCNMYTPDFSVNANISNNLNNGQAVDQVDYSCNWNKLTFGSSQTDRVAIPLYYDSATLGGQTTTVNPFNSGAAKNIVVRLRTPCVPCGQKLADGSTRTCDPTVKDETICSDSQRYVLDAATNDDIVAQWLINGECPAAAGGTEACGMTPIADKANYSNTFSALYESRILNNNSSKNKSKSDYSFIYNDTTWVYDTNNYPTALKMFTKLTSMTKPVLTLFLNKPLLTPAPTLANIPYLEYQVLTDQPISNTKSTLDLIVTVDGNTFKRTITKEVQKALIDFAIHN